MSVPEPPSALSRIPRGIWVLGGVSMLMDVSSELISFILKEGRSDAGTIAAVKK